MTSNAGRSFEHVLTERWYVVVDDVIGGYAVTNRNVPISDRCYYPPISEGVVVAEVPTKFIGEHVARLHNATLDHDEASTSEQPVSEVT